MPTGEESKAVNSLFKNIQEVEKGMGEMKTDIAVFASHLDHVIKDNVDFKSDIKKKLDDFLLNFDERLDNLACLNPTLNKDKLPWYYRELNSKINGLYAMIIPVCIALVVELLKSIIK